MKELVETEEEFGRDLQLVVERYLKPLDNPDVPRIVRDNKDIIFTNLKQIADFHNTYVYPMNRVGKEEKFIATQSTGHSLQIQNTKHDSYATYIPRDVHSIRCKFPSGRLGSTHECPFTDHDNVSRQLSFIKTGMKRKRSTCTHNTRHTCSSLYTSNTLFSL